MTIQVVVIHGNEFYHRQLLVVEQMKNVANGEWLVADQKFIAPGHHKVFYVHDGQRLIVEECEPPTTTAT